jgi:GTPase SAR1 family protein
MGKYAQFVMGPAGSGKSTYSHIISQYCAAKGRGVHVVNLDPAAELIPYKASIDVRELVNLTDVMEAMNLGPNGGLVYCMEFLLDNIEWLEEALGDYDHDYLIFDCPGQIELYTHIPLMKKLTKKLLEWNYNICSVFVLDSHFATPPSKFVSGTLYCLSSMIQMETPQINLLSKIDLIKKDPPTYKQLMKYMDAETDLMLPLLSEDTSSKLSKLNGSIFFLVFIFLSFFCHCFSCPPSHFVDKIKQKQ